MASDVVQVVCAGLSRVDFVCVTDCSFRSLCHCKKKKPVLVEKRILENKNHFPEENRFRQDNRFFKEKRTKKKPSSGTFSRADRYWSSCGVIIIIQCTSPSVIRHPSPISHHPPPSFSSFGSSISCSKSSLLPREVSFAFCVPSINLVPQEHCS